MTIGGRRIRTIDAHAHCVIPDAVRLLAKPVNREADLPMEGGALAVRLAAMDAQRIDTSVLSIVPNWYDAPRDLADQVVSLQNAQLADFCAGHADRFAALATVALQFPDAAADQLQHAVRTMGFRGVAIATTVAGVPLSDRRFDPFWAKAESLDVVVFIHPIDMPDPGGSWLATACSGK